MTKRVDFGVKRVSKEVLGNEINVNISLFSEAYSRDEIIKEIFRQISSDIKAENVLDVMVNSKQISVIDDDNIYPMNDECPAKIYIPLGPMTVVSVPKIVVPNLRRKVRVTDIIEWITEGAIDDKGRRVIANVNNCTGSIGLMLLYSANLDEAKEIMSRSYNIDNGNILVPRRGFTIMFGTQTIYSVTIRKVTETLVNEQDIRTIPTYAAILRWSASPRKDNYSSVREIIVYYTPDIVQIITDMKLLNELMTDMMNSALRLLGYKTDFISPLDVITGPGKDGWAYPYNSARRSGKAVFEVTETTLNKSDGTVEYFDYNSAKFIRMYNNGIDIDSMHAEAKEHELGYMVDVFSINIGDVVHDFRRRKRL